MRKKRIKKIPYWDTIKQIPTDRHTIQMEFLRWASNLPRTLCKCILSEPGSDEYNRNLLVSAVILERVASLVYRCWDGKYSKPSPKTYQAELFKPYAESPEEVFGLAAESGATPETAEHVHKSLWQIADLVCPMMANVLEHGFVSEYAYAIDYVIRHNGTLPEPEFKHPFLFPTNYENYHYQENVSEGVRAFSRVSF